MVVLASACLLAPVVAGASEAPGTQARATVEIRQSLAFYRIEARDLAGLRDAIARHAGADGAGEGHGRTRTSMSITYDARRVQDGCRAERVAIEAAIVTTLPRWSGREVAPDGLARRWDRSIEALELHESIHRRHALEAIASLASRLEGIGTQPDCIRLRREVYRQRLAVTTRWTWRDRRFDRTTRNGLAEGTRL